MGEAGGAYHNLASLVLEAELLWLHLDPVKATNRAMSPSMLVLPG